MPAYAAIERGGGTDGPGFTELPGVKGLEATGLEDDDRRCPDDRDRRRGMMAQRIERQNDRG